MEINVKSITWRKNFRETNLLYLIYVDFLKQVAKWKTSYYKGLDEAKDYVDHPVTWNNFVELKYKDYSVIAMYDMNVVKKDDSYRREPRFMVIAKRNGNSYAEICPSTHFGTLDSPFKDFYERTYFSVGFTSIDGEKVDGYNKAGSHFGVYAVEFASVLHKFIMMENAETNSEESKHRNWTIMDDKEFVAYYQNFPKLIENPYNFKQ